MKSVSYSTIFDHLDRIIGNKTYDERVSSLRIYGISLDKNIFETIKTLSRLLVSENIAEIVFSEEIQVDININDEFSELMNGVETTLKISKNKDLGVFFLTEKGFDAYLNSDDALQSGNISLLFSEVPFHTTNIAFANDFKKGIENNEPIEKSKINPVKYVRPLNIESQRLLPQDILSWLTENDSISNCKVVSWKKKSTFKILLTLASEIIDDSGNIELLYKGDRRKTVFLNKNNIYKIEDCFEIVTHCADWIYRESKDIDTRHALFNNQITQLISDSFNLDDKTQDFIRILNASLESSKLSYRYYLQNTSKELSKTLTDLNKTLFDYIGKIRQNTIDLISNLWKDLTTVLALLMLNFSTKKPEIPGSFYDFLGLGLSIYLFFSIFLSTRMNFWYYKNLKNNLNDWRSKIYSYLTDYDWDKYANNPLKSAYSKYITTLICAILLYVVMIGAVLIFTFEIDVWNLMKSK